MTKKIAKDETKPSSSNVVQKKEKKQFKHGSNVIMKLGTYKGYYGYVYDFYPAKVEVEIEDQQYINAEVYGKKKIGSTIVTEFGDSTIIDKKKRVYILNINKKEEKESIIPENVSNELLLENLFTQEKQKTKKIQLRLSQDEILEVVKYKKNNILKFGVYITRDEKYVHVRPIQLSYEELTYSELVKELSQKIKNNDLMSGDIQKFEKTSDIITFVTKGEYAGFYSENTQIIPAQYLITYKKKILLAKSQLKRQTSKLYVILNGAYKGKSAEVITTYPSHLSVYIDAAGKKVTKHMVKYNNGYIERYIYPSDVFYMDILLSNGNMFEVKEITDDNIIIGLEKTNNTLTPRQISKDDIQSLQPGFAFTQDTKEKLDLEESVYSYGDPVYEEKEFENNQDDEDGEMVGFEEEEEDAESDLEFPTEEPEEESTEQYAEESQYKSSYKDIERITFEGQELTKDQLKIKSKIEKISKQFSINTLNEFKLIKQVEDSIKSIKKQLNNVGMNFWNISDEKYIIVVIVLFDIIKSGYGSMISNIGEDTLTTYIQELISGSRPFFNKKDYANSIFMKSGWTESFETNEKIFKALLNTKDYLQIHKYIIQNCILVLEDIYGKVNLDVKTKDVSDLITLGKRKYEDEPRTRITVKDIFTGNVTDDATTILWGLVYQPLLEKYKNKLIEKINDENSNKTTRIVYDYVLQNIERGLFAIPEIKALYESSKSPIDELKYKKMSSIWASLMENAEVIYKNLEKEKQERKLELEKEKRKLSERRETITTMKRLKSFGLDDEEDSVELTYDRKYPSYLERIAKRHKL
jgi:hypothetical protein